AGVDLHARALFLVILDGDGQVRFARNLPANPDAFLRAVAPFRDGLLVACECMHCWYWLADTCREQHIAFVLGHAYSMKAVHGYKTKCDRKDAEAIARLLRGGNFPPAYAYPKERRGLRDLLRARPRLVPPPAPPPRAPPPPPSPPPPPPRPPPAQPPPPPHRRKVKVQPRRRHRRYRRPLRPPPRRDPPGPARTARHHHPPTREGDRRRRRPDLPHRAGRAAIDPGPRTGPFAPHPPCHSYPQPLRHPPP